MRHPRAQRAGRDIFSEALVRRITSAAAKGGLSLPAIITYFVQISNSYVLSIPFLSSVLFSL